VTVEPAPYDFRRPSRFSREHVRALQIVNETFARQCALVLSSTLHSGCQVALTSVTQLTCGEYTRRLPNPSLLAVLALDPLPGAGVFQLPMGVVMSIIDRLLGGPGGGNQPNRPLSDMETGIMRSLLQRVAHELTYAFDSLTAVHPLVGSLEFDPQFLQMAAPSEPVIVSDFTIRVGDQQAVCTLCLPFATLQPALDALTDSQAPYRLTADARTAHAVEQQMYAVPLEVRVAFREVSLPSSELLALAVGDVLPLRHPVAEPLAVVADGVQVAAAVPGSHGPRLACQVVSV
jgi:flagellar motor switch protein FliM